MLGPVAPGSRLLVASPNLALDITIRVPDLVPGSVSRAEETRTVAGGKGANVSRVTGTLGGAAVLVGFLGEQDGHHLLSLARQEGIEIAGVPTPGAVRLATAIITDDGQVTLINGAGNLIGETDWQRYEDAVRDRLPSTNALVCSGSQPPGAPVDGYRRLVELGHTAGLPVVVDAGPAALAEALLAGPDLVSPNLSEAEGLVLGRTDERVDERGPDIADRAVAAAGALHGAGAVRAVVTAGGSGAALATSTGSWWFPAVPVDVVNPIGAGDSFAAAATLALIAGAPDTEIVRRGMATASASCETPLAGVVAPARAAELFDQLRALLR